MCVQTQRIFSSLLISPFILNLVLHERKRHTDCHCHVASTCCAGLVGGTPARGTPCWGYPYLGRGYPLSAGWGIPCPDPLQLDGVPPIQTWKGVPPCSDLGRGTPCQLDGGTPLPVQTWEGGTPPSQLDEVHSPPKM